MRAKIILTIAVVLTMLAACASSSDPAPATATVEPGTPLTAEQTLHEYFNALRERRYADAANLISAFSLSWGKATRDGIVLHFERFEFDSDWQLTEYRIVNLDETPEMGITTARVWARESWVEDGQRKEDTYESTFSLGRSKVGSWLINYGGLVDVYTCAVPVQDHDGLSIRPTHVVRFLNNTRVVFDVSNSSDRGVSWGWASGERAALAAGDGRTYSYEGGSSKLQAGRSYEDVYFEFGQLVNGTPLTLTLKGWTWLNEHGLPDGDDEWGYEFDLEDRCTRQWSD